MIFFQIKWPFKDTVDFSLNLIILVCLIRQINSTKLCGILILELKSSVLPIHLFPQHFFVRNNFFIELSKFSESWIGKTRIAYSFALKSKMKNCWPNLVHKLVKFSLERGFYRKLLWKLLSSKSLHSRKPFVRAKPSSFRMHSRHHCNY